MDVSVKEEILDRLKSIRSFRSTSLHQYCMRCPLCGDSQKDPNKARFYLKINLNDDSHIVYYCHNCGETGILKPETLRSMNIHDMGLNNRLLNYNKTASKQIRRQYGVKKKKLKINIPIPENTERNLIKKQYIEDRLGVKLSFEDTCEFKTIYSLVQFAKVNNIEQLTVQKNRAIRLNNDYVGFLTANNEFINYRDITNKNKLRYDKYTIVPDLPDTVKFYSIPTRIDISNTEDIYINIAEGVFDILGVFFHVRKKCVENNVYVAVCGSGYMSVIKYFISHGFIGSNIHINIYSDSDKDPWFYNKINTEIKPWVGSINIYYNAIGKDFGVPKDHIKLTKKYPR